MNLGDLLGSGSAPAAGSTGIGGSGKGASGAGIFTGDNSAVFGSKNSFPPWMLIAGLLAGLVMLGLVWKLATGKK